jgi:hypothetical protein
MSRKRQRKSAYSKYKASVKYYLVKTFDWDNKEALDWLNSHRDYTVAMFASAAPIYTTAKNITLARDSYAQQ